MMVHIFAPNLTSDFIALYNYFLLRHITVSLPVPID